MLKKRNRVTSALFKLLEDADGVHTKHFFLKIIKNENIECCDNKFAIIVSKKVSNSAVTRNKIKRRIREALKNKIFLKTQDKSLLIAIYVKKGSENLSVRKIEKELGCTQVFHSL